MTSVGSEAADEPVPFGAWLDGMRQALRGEHDADVPCGTCTACCRASQFVHIGRQETDALAHIPAELLFPAPGRPDELLMGYDEQGRCPMLVDAGCSIHPHRPVACRMYDCRVFAATGVVPDDPGVADRARRWRFSDDTDGDRAARTAVAVAVERVRRDPRPPANATATAVRAVLASEAAGGD